MLGKIKKIRADLSENTLKSGYFITILHKNSGKLSTAPWKASAPYAYVCHSARYFSQASQQSLPDYFKL
jgi:hypothetical protein